MRFLEKADFSLTNFGNAVGQLRYSELNVAVSITLRPPLLRMIKYVLCVCLTQKSLVTFRWDNKFFEHLRCVPRTGLKPALREYREGWMNAKTVSAKSPVASNQKTFFFLLHVGANSALRQSEHFGIFFS